MRALLATLILVTVSAGPLSAIASADGGPVPSATASPIPVGSASPSPSGSPTASVSPLGSPTAPASPSGSPPPSALPSRSPTASASPSPPGSTPSSPRPSPSAIPGSSAQGATEVAAAPAPARALPPAVDVARLVTATSLAALVDARTRLAQSELTALQTRLAAVQADRDTAVADLVAFGALVDRRGAIRDRLLRDGLRAAALGVDTATLHGSSEEADAMSDQVAFANALAARRQQLTADELEIAATIESVAAKRAELAKLDVRARTLASTTNAGAAEIAVLRSLADDAAAAANAIAELTKGASVGAMSAAWSWPVSGVVTLPFGPSDFTLEPPLVFHGMAFAHFHDAIDIAAPLGTAVLAPAPGRVTFVGHLADGAMIVVIAHDDGLVSLDGHLDDAFAPPPVRVGDRVTTGQVVGYVGLTGMTTGPHLHFSVHDANGPVDPAIILAAR